MLEIKGICRQAVESFGNEHQINMAIEECAEFIDAISKLRRGRVSVREVATEIADVYIMMQQMAYIFGMRLVADEIESKLNRLRCRVDAKNK